ncbi:MAG: hypothetical protein HYZ75_05270 [Elusimicrobia bacterium]|nr:hypothetical protein [Elusimicrobiota bacterium]
MVALLTVLLGAAGARAVETAQPGPVALAAPPPGGFWMKRYPVRAYGAFWHLEVAAKDFAKAREKVEKVLAKRKGVSTVPASSQVGSEKVRYMQWSYVLSRDAAAKALEDLRKLGAVKRETQTENLLPGTDDIPVKLQSLSAERAAAGADAARYPAAFAAAAEIVAHLEEVERSWKDSQDKVLLNLALEEAPR